MTRRTFWDVIIVGAGPAGASAARTLAQSGAKVMLLERLRFPRPKMCTGMLSPDAQLFLKAQFPELPSSVYCQPRSSVSGVALHTPSLQVPLTLPFVQPAANIDRARLDAFLVQAAKVSFCDAHAGHAIEEDKRGYILHCTLEKGQAESYRTRYLIIASGGNGKLAGALEPSRVDGLPWGFALQMRLAANEAIADGLYHRFLSPALGFFAWALEKDNLIYAGVGTTRREKLKQYRIELLALLQRLFKLDRTALQGTSAVAGPWLSLGDGPFLGSANLLIAGDAAGLMNKGGEGISLALQSGHLAGKAILHAESIGGAAAEHYKVLMVADCHTAGRQPDVRSILKANSLPRLCLGTMDLVLAGLLHGDERHLPLRERLRHLALFHA